MLKKKICMVGDFAVGKTSLTQKFVNNVFSDKYLTTVGVKIDTAMVNQTKLVVWDIAGRDSLSPINSNYLVGASGVILVADGTRSDTLMAVPKLKELVVSKIGEVPMALAINKCDLPDWDVTPEHIALFEEQKLLPEYTSAKDGDNVEKLFAMVAS